MANMQSSAGGIGVLGALGVLFIGLKLGGVIDWSWWFVTMPLWIGFAIFAAVFLVVVVGLLLFTPSRKRR